MASGRTRARCNVPPLPGDGAYHPSPEERDEIARRVSVVAVNYNGLPVLERFVASVWASEAPPLELVVVDNGSADGSIEWLRGREDVRLVVSSHNRGFGGGATEGAAHARGDLLLFANPDVEFRPDMLGALASNLISHPNVAVTFPTMVDASQDHRPEPKLDDVASMAGAVMLVERPHFEAMGGFDPRIFLYYEETDFCWRTRLAGRRVTQDGQAVALHDSHGSGGGPRWAAEQIRNGLLVHLKTRAWPAVARFVFWMIVKTAVRGIQYRDPQVLSAWTVNARRLPAVLAERRRLLRAASPAIRAELELLCSLNDYWRRFYRRQALRDALRRRLRNG